MGSVGKKNEEDDSCLLLFAWRMREGEERGAADFFPLLHAWLR
jgi:hypothetical protein